MTQEEMLCIKICHDLINPINAINLCMESYEMTNDQTLLACVKESTNKCMQILVFLRASTNCDRAYNNVELFNIIQNYLKLFKINVIHTSNLNNFDHKISIIIFNLVHIIKDILPYGGDATFNISNKEINVTITGKSITQINIQSTPSDYRNVFHSMAKQQFDKVGCQLIIKFNSNNCEIKCA